MAIIWCMVLEIWSVTDKMFCHSGQIFALLPPYGPRKSKFWKNEKNNWRYYHFTNAYYKWQSYDAWFLRYGVQRREFLVILDCFLPFYPLTTWKIKILKKWKKHLEILSFYTGIPWMTITWCMVPEIMCVTDNIFCHFGPFFALLPPNNLKEKKQLEISSFYTSVPKIMIMCCTVPEIWHITGVIVIFHSGLSFALLPP